MAAELRLNPGTVAHHLRRAVSKLGVASRADLAGAVAESGDPSESTALVAAPHGRADWAAQQRTLFLLDHFGGVTKLADALDVSKSQPSRWKTGEEVPGPEAATRLLDLDHVFAFGMQAWDPTVVSDWLESPNGYLDGARPVDVLRLRGSAEVIDALRAAISGAYA